MEKLKELIGMTIHGCFVSPKTRTSLRLIDHRVLSNRTLRCAELNFIRTKNQEFSFEQIPTDIEEIICSSHSENEYKIIVKLTESEKKIVCVCEDIEIFFKNFN